METLDLNMPTSWNQLTQKQLLYLCRLFLMNLTEHKFKLYLFLNFTGTKALPDTVVENHIIYYTFKKGEIKFNLTPEELYWFLKSTDLFLSDSQLTINPFPEFTLGNKTFYGPANKCYNITFLEFLNIEAAIHRFHATRDLKHLFTLCSIMYRPQQKNYNPEDPMFDGDRREIFNDYTYSAREKYLKKLSPRKLYAVYIFYIGCRNALMEAHSELFKSNQVSTEPVNPVNNIKKIMVDLNMGDITKNKQIQHTQIWEVFFHLQEMVIKSKPKK